MMTSVEEKEIVRKYLLSRKLPLDILMEVEDHFLSQLDEIQTQKNNISFKDSFEKVKGFWKDDLKIVRYHNGNEVALFAKKIKDKETNKILFESLILSLAIVSVVVLLAKLCKKDYFENLITGLALALLGFSALYYFFNRSRFNLISKYKPFKINIYQNARIFVFMPVLMCLMGSNSVSKMTERIHDYINAESQVVLSSLLLISIFSWFYSFGILFQIAFIQSVKKMPHFLKTFNLQK